MTEVVRNGTALEGYGTRHGASRCISEGATLSLKIVLGGILAGVACCVSACSSHSIQLTAGQKVVQAQLTTIEPRHDPLVAKTPVIDIHTHTFNARYLPLRGILLGKRDAAPPVSWFISDHCAGVLADALVRRTELAAIAGQPGAKRMDGLDLRVDVGPICRVALKLINKAVMAGAWEKGISYETKMQRLDSVANSMDFSERAAIRATAGMMGMDDPVAGAKGNAAIKALVRFLWTITQSDAEMLRLYQSAYAQSLQSGPVTIVSHTMDLGPVYDQPAEGNELLDFAHAQVRRAEAFQAQAGSNLIYFVAYIPYRDDWRGGKPGDSLRLVQDAVKNHGAWGVKFYPPSGYRPSENEVVRRARAFLTKFPGAQWDARYGALGMDAGRELDHRTEELLQWCIQNDVPVFVHSGTGEFEARKGYGLHHSNPKFWRAYLESHPEPDGSPCKLRLCLGHAGGGSFWFKETAQADWGKDVYDLCREFPNVYCEITTHAELAEPTKQAYFVDHLAELFAAGTGAQVPGHKYPQRYAFGKKLLYGTDWYLPDAGERHLVLRAAQQAFLHPRLRAFFRDYFCDNAARYLRVADRLRGKSIPAAVRQRMGRFSSASR